MSGLSADKIFIIEKKCRQDRTGISAVGRFSVLLDIYRSLFALFTRYTEAEFLQLGTFSVSVESDLFDLFTSRY
jgi:hypothetical protein